MKINASDGTGVAFFGDARHLDDDAIADLNTFEFTREQVRRQIDNLNVSADVKLQLHSIREQTIEAVTVAGKVIIRIGRKILDIILWIMREFPNATFGVVFGLVVGHLVGLIPVIGFLIGPLVGTILTAFGFVQGMAHDLREKNIGRRTVDLCSQFTALRTE